jgi:hypothetical protein
MKKDKPYYWYHFADGYSCAVRGMSSTELKHEVLRHGKLMAKVKA